jgi:two-component system sensor histidine kinase KdpD
MLRGLVGLVEAQSAQVASLREVIDKLEGRLALRAEADSMLGHELQRPLAVIIGVLETLHVANVSDESRADLVNRALRQSSQLAEMIDDLLTVADETATYVPRVTTRQVRLRDVIDQARAAVPDLPSSRLIMCVDDEVTLNTAPARLVAIVANLLENAARYGGESIVELSASLDDDRQLLVEVSDRGPGLEGVPSSVLFEAFARGQQATTTPGSGVGLYLVRMLAHSLGGEVTLTDRDGGGATARVTLPQRRGDDPLPALSREDARPRRRRSVSHPPAASRGR